MKVFTSNRSRPRLRCFPTPANIVPVKPPAASADISRPKARGVPNLCLAMMAMPMLTGPAIAKLITDTTSMREARVCVQNNWLRIFNRLVIYAQPVTRMARPEFPAAWGSGHIREHGRPPDHPTAQIPARGHGAKDTPSSDVKHCASPKVVSACTMTTPLG